LKSRDWNVMNSAVLRYLLNYRLQMTSIYMPSVDPYWFTYWFSIPQKSNLHFWWHFSLTVSKWSYLLQILFIWSKYLLNWVLYSWSIDLRQQGRSQKFFEGGRTKTFIWRKIEGVWGGFFWIFLKKPSKMKKFCSRGVICP
jgi:hypothetical protein